MTYHDLGHIHLFAGWAPKIINLPGAKLFGIAFDVLERRLSGSEKECDDDRHGLGLCLAGGQEGPYCLELQDILTQYALYLGDSEMVYGPSEQSDDELNENARCKTKAQTWA